MAQSSESETSRQTAQSNPAQRPPDKGTQPSSRFKLTPSRLIVPLLAVATVVILVWALFTPAPASTPGTGTPGAAAPQVGHYAPDASLLNLSNTSVRLSSMRGQVVVLNFWYVACEPCRYEMPALEKAYLAHKSQGLVVVGVNTSDDAQTISDFTNQIGITYPILRDLGERVTIQYKVTATPTTFVVDRHGVIRAKIAGPLDNDAVAKYVLPLLNEK
jgi:cytochrome c biogenesis protein CcmG, thiol:disulfide interchange protein DsbE